MSNSLQRIALLKITKAYSTVSTAAIQVLSGILPINFVCESYQRFYKLKFKGVNLRQNNCTIEYHDVDWEEGTSLPLGIMLHSVGIVPTWN